MEELPFDNKRIHAEINRAVSNFKSGNNAPISIGVVGGFSVSVKAEEVSSGLSLENYRTEIIARITVSGVSEYSCECRQYPCSRNPIKANISERSEPKMNRAPKPQLKLFLTRDAFNTFYSILTFFVASEAQAGETYYSRTAAKMMSQFVNFGSFIEKKNNDMFLIYLYESEVMKIARMYNKYISVHQNPCKDYFTEFKNEKKIRQSQS
jgi:hypothetical protein